MGIFKKTPKYCKFCKECPVVKRSAVTCSSESRENAYCGKYKEFEKRKETTN